MLIMLSDTQTVIIFAPNIQIIHLELWGSILNLFGVDWVIPRRVNNFVVSSRGQVGRGSIMEVWGLAPLCLMCCLWRERNARSFEDVATSMLALWRIMFNTLYTWISAYHSLPVSSFADSLNLCSSFFPDYEFLLYTSSALGLCQFALI
jgi:hypothetical protein